MYYNIEEILMKIQKIILQNKTQMKCYKFKIFGAILNSKICVDTNGINN